MFNLQLCDHKDTICISNKTKDTASPRARGACIKGWNQSFPWGQCQVRFATANYALGDIVPEVKGGERNDG